VLGGATIGKTIFACVYIEKKNLLQNQQANFKHGTNHHWVKGILNCSNKGSDPLQRRNNHKNAKMRWGHLKIFLKTTEPEEFIFT
jgi:hypothetical protein